MLSLMLEYPESSVLFLVALVCVLQSWLLKKDFFNPPTVYCFSQCITLGIAYIQLDKTMSDFQLKTWLFWIGALLSFCAGSFLVRLVAKSRGASVRLAEATPPENYSWKMHILLSFIPFLLFVVGVFGIIKTAGNLLLLTDNPAKWMNKDTDYGLYAAFFSSGPLCVLLFGVATFKKYNPVKRLRRLARFMVLFTIVINFMAYPSRGTLFLSIGILVIFFNYLRKRISASWIMVFLAFAAAAFIGIASIRDQYAGNSVESMALDVMMDLPYKYVSNNYWNFDYAINPPPDKEYHPHTYGIDFFYGMFEYFRVSGSFRYSYRWDGLFNERIEKVHGFNTASYLWEVYKDLYAPGIFLLPFFVGLALSVLHLRMCRRDFTPRAIVFYTLFIYIIGWWFFTPAYKQGVYWVWFAILFTVTTVSGSYSRKVLKSETPVLDKVSGENEGEQQVAAQGE